MLNQHQKELIVRLLNEHLQDLRLVYLFGSVANGSDCSDSDIDIAVLCLRPIDTVERWNLSQKLSVNLDRDVDLIDLASCSTVMSHQVLSSGKLLFDDGFSAEFEVVSMSMYQHLNESREGVLTDFLESVRNG